MICAYRLLCFETITTWLLFYYVLFYYYSRAPAVFPSENPSFTLFYFNIKALAEPIRYLFAYGGQAFEDVRVTRDEWPALKPSKFIFVIKLLFSPQRG